MFLYFPRYMAVFPPLWESFLLFIFKIIAV